LTCHVIINLTRNIIHVSGNSFREIQRIIDFWCRHVNTLEAFAPKLEFLQNH
jgi:hypothetical protein